jgi:hypoxanthine phosphoribosyltransferase
MARAPAALRLVADRAARALAATGVPAAGEGLAAAVSGGADSLALLHALRTLAGPRGWRLAVVTVDHGLRPGSAADAAFVADHAKALGLEARVETLAPADLARHRAAGQEGAARAARYQALWRAAGELGCGWLATGHTLDDQAETVLLQLLRGAGPDGLAGMTVRGGRLLRPLLGVRRTETRACCAAVGVRWREDPTNQEPGPLRNRVRQRLLPLLEELRPGAAAALARTAGLAADERAWLDPVVAAALTAAATPAGRGPGAGRGRAGRAARRPRQAGGPGRRQAGRGRPAGRRRHRPDPRPGRRPPCRRRPTRRRDRVAGWPRLARGAGGPARGPRDRRPRPLTGQLGFSPLPRGPQEQTVVYEDDIESVLLTQEQVQGKVRDLAAQISKDYAGRDVLLVGVLKGAFILMADLARHLTVPHEFDFMAVSSYGSATQTSGVVRILKDLDREIQGRDVLIVEDIIDSGLTLNYLLKNLRSRRPATLEVCALLYKPEQLKADIEVKYAGFDIPSVFVVGYGLDYAERYRNLPFVATLKPEVYRGR